MTTFLLSQAGLRRRSLSASAVTALTTLALVAGPLTAWSASATETPPTPDAGADTGTVQVEVDGTGADASLTVPSLQADDLSAAQVGAAETKAPHYSVVPLNGGGHGEAVGINETGVIVGTIALDGEKRPVVWRGRERILLDNDGAEHVRATAVGDDGTVGGWLRTPDGTKKYAVAWRLDEDGDYGDLERVAQVKSFQDPLHGGRVESVGADGALHITQPVGEVPLGSEMVIRKGAVIELSSGAASPVGTFDMSDNGMVAGGVNRSATPEAALWGPSGGAPTTLPHQFPEAGSSTGWAVNDAGHVAASSAYTLVGGDTAEVQRRHVGLWRDGAWVDMGTLYDDPEDPRQRSNLYPSDVSDADDVVGFATVLLGGRSTTLGFLWHHDTLFDLNALVAPPAESGWIINEAHSINEAGQIVGVGTKDGVRQPILLDATKPLIFVPGAGASILESYDNPEGPEQIWLGCGTNRLRLSRFPEDNPDQDVRAVDATRYLSCYGLDGHRIDALNAYGGMLDQLTTTYGYREYDVAGDPSRRTTEGCDLSQRASSPNLFVFAYDWRQDNRVTARELEDYVGCVQKMFPGTEIDMATHSMGSLVARRYVMNHRADHGLHKIVTIGAPWLGAPKLVNVLNTGDFIDSALANGGSERVKRVVAGFPAAHQLMAGPYYHDLAGSVFSENGWDYDGDGFAFEDYQWDNLKQALDTRWSRTAPADTAESFQTQGGADGQADWRDESEGGLWTHVYGIQAGQNTIGRITAEREVFCPRWSLICVTHDYIDQTMTSGDGTVPTTSANRVSAEDDLNAPGARLVPVPVFDADENATVEHTGLTRHPRTLKTLVDTFRDTLSQRSLRAAGASKDGADVPYRYVTLRGARDIVLHDGRGNDDAPLDAETRVKLPGTQHLSQGEDAELVTMPADVTHPWTVTFTGTGEPMSLESLEGTQSAPEVAVRWRDLVVPEGNAAELVLTATGLERLRVDTDGDGTVDTTVPATADLTGDDARDVEAPTVELAAVTVDGQRRYAVRATDGRDGSGVRRILWSTDGTQYADYTDPVRAPLAATLFAFAEDRAGNRSVPVELDLNAATNGPQTTAAVSPAPSDSGWSAGPATVRLTATADGVAGAAVAGIRYRTTGAVEIEETLAEGDTVDVEVSAPGRTTVWFQAVDADGTTEPWRQQMVRIDLAAPTARLLSPLAGSVVGSLGQIAGTSADDASGVRQVEVLLERTSDGATWDGTSWTQERSWIPARGRAGWRTDQVPSADRMPVGAYAVRARVTDGADRVVVTPAVTVTKTLNGRMSLVPLEPITAPTNTSASAINDSGTVVGATGRSTSINVLAGRWVNGAPEELALPDGFEEGQASAVAPDGSAAGHASSFTGSVAVRWDADGTAHRLPALAGADRSQARGISAAGVVGVSGERPVWWHDGEVRALPTLQPGQKGSANDIDSAGTIVGEVVDSTGVSHAVVWTEGGRKVTDLGTLEPAGPRVGSRALAINEVGQVVGISTDSRGRGVAFVADVREGEAMTEVYVPSRWGSGATDIADDGTIVGTYTMGDGDTPSGFVVRDGRFHDVYDLLDPETEWVPTKFAGVNGLGQLTGFALRYGTSVGRAFVATTTHAPVARDAAADTDEGVAVTVGLSATDPDPGSSLTLRLAGQPAHGTATLAGDGTVTYVPDDGFSGTDIFGFTADDGALRSNLGLVSVTVRPGADPNQRPEAVIVAPVEAPEGSTVTVDGSTSSDADGSVTAYAWDLDGDGAFDDADGPTAELEVPDSGVLPIALRVTDDAGATGEAGSSVTGVNVAPLVSMPSSVEAAPGESVRIAGSFTDPGRDRWSATVETGDGPRDLPLDGRDFVVGASWAQRGSHPVTVTVCDEDACGEATTTVEVSGNDAPVAALDAPATAVEGQTIALDASGSADVDGEVAAYAWDLDGDGAYDDATGPTATRSLSQDGAVTVGVEVTDDDGATGTAQAVVLVTDVAPTLQVAGTSGATAGQAWSLPGTVVDPGDDSWVVTADSGAGPRPVTLTGRQFTLQETFAAAGQRSVVVRVCDGTVCSTATVQVTVAGKAWPWQGFFAPVDNLPTVNAVKAGQAVPLKFSLGGYRGMDIFAGGAPSSVRHSCQGEAVLDDIEQTVTPGSADLTYDQGTGRYQYVWKTQRSWAGQCRTLVVTLNDGSVHKAEFRFR